MALRSRLTTAPAALAVALSLGLLAGCSNSVPPSAAQGKDEEPVTAAFAALQAALKAKDGEKILALLDDESREEAERVAKAMRDGYAKATPAERGDVEKTLGLSAAELGSLNAAGFLKSKRFRGTYDEVSESKIEKVTVQGDKATVTFVEPDGDKERLSFVRKGGEWKASLAMPKVN